MVFLPRKTYEERPASLWSDGDMKLVGEIPSTPTTNTKKWFILLYYMYPCTGEVWQHYKTKGEYEILFIGKMQMKNPSLDMKECVIYKSLEDDGVWVRPLSDFIESVVNEEGKSVGRFTKIH